MSAGLPSEVHRSLFLKFRMYRLLELLLLVWFVGGDRSRKFNLFAVDVKVVSDLEPLEEVLIGAGVLC